MVLGGDMATKQHKGQGYMSYCSFVLFSDAISRSFLLLSQAAVCFRIHLFRYVLPSDPQTGEGCKIMQDQGEQSWAFDFWAIMIQKYSMSLISTKNFVYRIVG